MAVESIDDELTGSSITSAPLESKIDINTPQKRFSDKNLLLVVLILFLVALFQAIHSFSRTHSRSTVVLEAAGFACIVGLIAWMRVDKANRDRHLAYYWIVPTAVLGVCFCFLMPPGMVPDEPVHFQSAYYYSDIFMGDVPQAGSLTMRACDSGEILYSNNEGQQNVTAERSDYKKIVSSWSWTAGDTELMTVNSDKPDLVSGSISANPVWIRLPAAIGIALARLLGLGAYPLYYLGRLLSLAAFLSMTFFAIRVTPVGKSVFVSVSLLPMTMQLASSYSYDSMIIGLALLLTAFCLKAIYGEGTISAGNCIGIIVLTLLLVTPKIIYALIGLLIFLVPSKRFSSRRNEVLVKAIIPFLIVFFTAIVESSRLIALSGGMSTTGDGLDYRGTETGHFFTLSDILRHPRNALLVFLNTLAVYGDFYFFSMLTGPLGWFQTSLAVPGVLAVCFFTTLVFSMLSSVTDNAVPSGVQRLGLVLVFCVVAFGVILSMWLGWTFDNETVINGVQGRYFLPVLPLLLISLRPKKIQYQGDVSGRVLVAMLFFSLMNIVCVYSNILMT